MTPTLSIIVCTGSRHDYLSTCLKSLLKQHHEPLEILVVDNDPEDTRIKDLLQKTFPSCRYISEPVKGAAHARNRGIIESFGDILAYVDDDCRPVAGWSRAIVHNFSQMSDLGCCTGPVLPMELKTRSQRLLEERGGLSRGFARCVFTRSSPVHLSSTYPVQSWRFGTGANMAFRRSMLNRIGGFDSSICFAEDLEMFFRVVRSDYELVYEPRAVVFHRHPRTYKELRRTLHLWGRGYMSSLLKIACTDPLYRKMAISEASAWFWSFQVRDRLCRGLVRKKTFPLGLVLAELTGGCRAVLEHFFTWNPEREESGTSPRLLSPLIRLLRR